MKRPQAPAHFLLAAACTWAPACGLNQSGVQPPNDTIAYPASAVLDRDGDWLFVTNSNADLRFNDGTLMALSLERAEIDRTPNDELPDDLKHPEWDDCPQVNYPDPRSESRHFCCWDVVNHRREVLNCDERHYVGSDTVAMNPLEDGGRGNGNVRIGSFAAGMVLQRAKCPVDYTQGQSYGRVACDLCNGYGEDPANREDDRLLLGVRGDTSLTFVDVESRGPAEPPLLKCTTPPGDPPPDPPEEFPSCDPEHRVIRAMSGLASPSVDENPPDIPLPDEPYALTLDDDAGLLFIGHLTGNTSRPYTGGFSLFDVTPTGHAGALEAPRFIAPFLSPFAPNNVGALGVTSLKTRKETADPNRLGATLGVYASSRYAPQVVSLGTTADCPIGSMKGDPYTPSVPIREIAAFPSGTSFNSPLGGAEMRGVEFVGTRRAFVLQRSPPTLIAFLDGTPTDVLETCSSPTFLDQFELSPDLGPRLFVTCPADGEVYVFDPSVPRLEKTFLVGRGPAGLVLDRKRSVAYVVGFGDNNISVVDLTPGSATEYDVIQRIGFPRTMPR